MSDEKTDQLVARWDMAKTSVEGAKRLLNSSECDLRNATNALAKWLTPDDVQKDETFSIWKNGRLLSVQYNKATSNGIVWERQNSKREE